MLNFHHHTEKKSHVWRNLYVTAPQDNYVAAHILHLQPFTKYSEALKEILQM